MKSISRQAVWKVFDKKASEEWWNEFRNRFFHAIAGEKQQDVATVLRLDTSALCHFLSGRMNLEGRKVAWSIRKYNLPVPDIAIGEAQGFMDAISYVKGEIDGNAEAIKPETYCLLRQVIRRHEEWHDANQSQDRSQLERITREVVDDAAREQELTKTYSVELLQRLVGVWLKPCILACESILSYGWKSVGIEELDDIPSLE